jgi:hypothetical protein
MTSGRCTPTQLLSGNFLKFPGNFLIFSGNFLIFSVNFLIFSDFLIFGQFFDFLIEGFTNVGKKWTKKQGKG